VYFALVCALDVNSAILILAAAAFHATNPTVDDLAVAYKHAIRAQSKPLAQYGAMHGGRNMRHCATYID
jgi:Mn2+/Fe2+ NRAMP family transporter